MVARTSPWHVALVVLVATLFLSAGLVYAAGKCDPASCKTECKAQCKHDGKGECKGDCKASCKDKCKNECGRKCDRPCQKQGSCCSGKTCTGKPSKGLKT